MESTNYRCIYCLEIKPVNLFNGEHVIHKSMTKRIQKNLILHGRVCETCNSTYGKTMDLKLSRSYFEGLNRFRQDMKPVSESHHLDQKNIQWSVADPEAFHNEIGDFTEVLGDCLILSLSDTTKKIFTLGQLRRKPLNELVDLDKIEMLSVFTGRQDRADAIGELIKPHVSEKFQLAENLEKHKVTATVTYDEIAQRAIAKIAFNYFALVTQQNPDIVFEKSFDSIRKFIYRGIFPSIRPVQKQEELSDFALGGLSLNGHWIRLYKNPDLSTVIAKVSLFNQWIWKVVLSSNYQNGSEIPTSSHVWDIDGELCQPILTNAT